MKEKSLHILVKHFCLDSVDSSESMVLFPPRSLDSTIIMDIFGKLIVYGLETTYSIIKDATSLDEIISIMADNIKSTKMEKYYFIDSSTKLKRKTKKNISVRRIISEDDLKKLESCCNADDWDKAYISLSDEAVTGLYQDEILSACSLIKVDEVYDLGIITRNDQRHKGYSKNLLYNFLKQETKDKLIRMIVNEENIPMIKTCESLGLQSDVRILEIKMK